MIASQVLRLDITESSAACRYVHQLRYGYYSDRDDLLNLFKEKVLIRNAFHRVSINQVLHAREDGLKQLKSNI